MEDEALTGSSYLGDAPEPSEGRGVQDPVSITLTFRSLIGWPVVRMKPIVTAWWRHTARELPLRKRDFELAVPTQVYISIVNQPPNRIPGF